MEPPAKRPRTGGPDEQSVPILVPPEDVSLVIGKKGDMIKQIESSCGAGVSFLKEDEIIQNAPLRRCTLTGNREGLAEAVRMILPLIARRGTESQDQMKLIILVPDPSVSFLIGKKGASVQEIQSQSQTLLSFAKPQDMQSSRADRALSIVGELEQIMKAFVIVLDLLEQFRTNEAPEGYPSPPPPPPMPPRPTYGRANTPQVPQYAAQPAPWAVGNDYGNGVVRAAIEMHLALPDHLTGTLIGARGIGIKRIQDSCLPEKIFISFAKPEEAQECPDGGGLLRPVTLRGSIQACMKAQGELLQSLQAHAHNRNEPVVFRSTTMLGPRGETEAVEAVDSVDDSVYN